MQPLLLPITEAARALGIGRTSLYRLITERKVALVKIGRRSLVTSASLDAFAASLAEGDMCTANSASVPAATDGFAQTTAPSDGVPSATSTLEPRPIGAARRRPIDA